MADEMIILDGKGKDKLIIDSSNEIVTIHECIFTNFDEDSICSIPGCGKLLGDLIIEGIIPIIRNKNGMYN
jgi:hypothetical protein